MNLQPLIEAVQTNCDIADARHARDMTMCTYLLEMRDFFRWENDLPLTRPPPREELGNWLIEREARWEEMEQRPFGQVPVAAQRFDPFDVEGVNAAILDEGLVYGAGYGRFNKPHFFLARLARQEERDGFTVLVSGCEYARDLVSDPGAMRGETIYVRSEAVRRWLWEKAEAWGFNRREGALSRALTCYGFGGGNDAALDRMTGSETESIILHELGEGAAGRLLGEGWENMLGSFTHRKPEIMARAARDNLADCLSTLPALIARGDEGPVHFYFSNFDGMRRQLFPELVDAYRSWAEGDAGALTGAVDSGAERWLAACGRVLQRYRSDPAATEAEMPSLLETTAECCTTGTSD